MPASKPTTLASAVLDTGEADYADLVYAVPFLEDTGSSTNVAELVATGTNDATVTLNGSSAWDNTTEPYGLVLDDNQGVGNCGSIAAGAFAYASNTHYTHYIVFQIDSIDPTNTRPGFIFSGSSYAAGVDSTSVPTNSTGFYAHTDDTVDFVVANSAGAYRAVRGVPYALGVDGLVAMCLRYDDATHSGYSGGTANVRYNGTTYATTAGSGTDRPGSAALDGPIHYARPSSTELTECGFNGKLCLHLIYDTLHNDTTADAKLADIYSVFESAGGGISIPLVMNHFMNQGIR